MNPQTDSVSSGNVRKPRLSFFFATAAYVGYLPKAPGTWGSLVGVLLAWLLPRHQSILLNPFLHPDFIGFGRFGVDSLLMLNIAVVALISLSGVWLSGRVANHLGKGDPQCVVIDEVSGQMITLLAAGWTWTLSSDDLTSAAHVFALVPLNWKYLLLGFILFRVFDIWKPFPVRQAESLRGGWGIMADDWMAAVYAAIGIWIARAMGL